MKENYSVNWSVFDNKELTSILTKVNPDLLCDIENILIPGNLPCLDVLTPFESKVLSRPLGSNRAFCIKNNNNESVIVVKGTEPTSSNLKSALETDKLNKLPNRPWTILENFIYREQKAPLAMLFNEASSEALIGTNFQISSFNTFGFFEEAPLPLLTFKWSDEVTTKYKNLISQFLDQRAKDLIFPLIDRYGIGGVVYYYPYLPTRVRFSDKKLFPPKYNKLEALDCLLNIQARMLLNGYFPFSFEDHGIGQCIAPQNVTLRGGICDLGSIKSAKEISNKQVYILLQAMGAILSRTATEIFGSSVSDTVYEFENPTTLQHYLSAVIHDKLRHSLNNQSSKYCIGIADNIKNYYTSGNSSLKIVLGIQ